MSNLSLGDNAIPFELPATDGAYYSLDNYGDKVAVAVIFSCNHCPYVLAWEDRIIKLQADYADKGVQFIAINANNAESHPVDSFDKMQDHAKEKQFNFPYLRDEDQTVASAYGAERTPEIFLFDADRTLRYHGAPDDNYENPEGVTQPYFRDALEAVLAGTAPAIAETAPKGCTIKWKA
mgnify:CR=1 FL=1